MAGGGEKASGADALARATEAVRKATEAVQTTSRSIAEAVEAGRRPRARLGRKAIKDKAKVIAKIDAVFEACFAGIMAALARRIAAAEQDTRTEDDEVKQMKAVVKAAMRKAWDEAE
jgi:hypothetical protein